MNDGISHISQSQRSDLAGSDSSLYPSSVSPWEVTTVTTADLNVSHLHWSCSEDRVPESAVALPLIRVRVQQILKSYHDDVIRARFISVAPISVRKYSKTASNSPAWKGTHA